MLMIKRKILKEVKENEHDRCKFKLLVDDKIINITLVELRGSYLSLCIDAPPSVIIRRNDIVKAEVKK